MRQLFQNLIGNGLKYRGEEKPVVRVYSNLCGDSFWEIHVSDNGIGFDERYLDKIFKPFQRLHGKEAPYEGTGMGLAICRRIVERHGGSITARSEPGKGATFIVKLPKNSKRLNSEYTERFEDENPSRVESFPGTRAPPWGSISPAVQRYKTRLRHPTVFVDFLLSTPDHVVKIRLGLNPRLFLEGALKTG